MPAGRPRKTSLPPADMVALGKEMIQWIKDNPKALHLSAWYSIEKMIMESQWRAMIQLPEFLPYYEQALKLVGQKYLDKDSNVRDGISQRWQRVYFKDLKHEEDADLDAKMERELEKEKKKIRAELEMKAEMAQQYSEEAKKMFTDLMNQVTSLHSSNNASISNSTDSIS